MTSARFRLASRGSSATVQATSLARFRALPTPPPAGARRRAFATGTTSISLPGTRGSSAHSRSM